MNNPVAEVWQSENPNTVFHFKHWLCHIVYAILVENPGCYISACNSYHNVILSTTQHQIEPTCSRHNYPTGLMVHGTGKPIWNRPGSSKMSASWHSSCVTILIIQILLTHYRRLSGLWMPMLSLFLSFKLTEIQGSKLHSIFNVPHLMYNGENWKSYTSQFYFSLRQINIRGWPLLILDHRSLNVTGPVNRIWHTTKPVWLRGGRVLELGGGGGEQSNHHTILTCVNKGWHDHSQ